MSLKILHGIFYLLLLLNISNSVLKSQFDVDCPRSCHCNKTTVQCIRPMDRGAELFLQIHPLAYPDLDTIIVSGTSIGDIAGSNLFGTNVTHHYVTLVNLSNNAITAIDSYTFQGLPTVEFFYLNDNSIERIGPDPFRHNIRIRLIDLTNFFAPNVPLKDRPSMVSTLFTSVNEFNDLQELILQENSLSSIPPNAFCSLNGLIRLHLANNKLRTFAFKEGCLQTLNVLDLSGNEIKTVSADLWDRLPSLATLDISSNPLNCGCNLAPALELLSKSPTASLNQGRTVCASPESRKGKNAFEIADFDCKKSHRLLYLAIAVIFLSIAFVLYRTYRKRISFKHLPLVAGYSKLGAENENIIQPQYV